MGGQFANESNSIGHQERKIVDGHFANSGIECGEKFVLGKNIRLGQKIKQCGFSYIGISDQCHTNQFPAIFALCRFLLVDLFKPLFAEIDSIEHNTTVGLNLSFTGSTHANTTFLSFEVCPKTCQTGEEILILCKFNLSLGSRCLCSACEDIKNKAGAIENLYA